MKRFLTGLIAALILLGVSAASAQIGTPICGALVGTTINCTTVTSTGQFLGAGSASSPGFAFSATPTSGWYRRSGGSMDYSYSGVGQASFNQDNGLYLIAAYPINWTSGVIGASADTGLSRVSAGVVGVGTGAAGSVAGALQAASLTANGLSSGRLPQISTGGLFIDSPDYIWGDTGSILTITIGRSGAKNGVVSLVGGSNNILFDTGVTNISGSGGIVKIGTGATGSFAGTLKLTTLQGGTSLTLDNAAAGTMTIGSNAVTPASTGTRYLCISTTGVVTSSALACSGT
jgi:hypothetical protein